MDDVDLKKFVDHMRRVKAAVVEQDGASAESHTVDVPYGSREAILTRIEKDLYRDAMALDVTNIIGGAATATQIRAAYEPLNEKDDDFEYYVTDAITKILELAGVEDTLSYSRSVIVNKNEEIGIVLQASEYLPEKYVTEKILTILGDADRLDEIMEEKENDEAEMYAEEDGEEEDAEALEGSDGEESTEDSELDDFMSDFEEEDSEGAEDAENAEEEEEEDTGALDALMEKLKKILGRLG
jgi:enoyl reductase-like protein